MSRGALITFLVEHPSHWLPMLRQGSRAAGAVRVGYLSNYQLRRAPAAFLAPRPDLTHELLAALGPASWPLLPLVWLAVGLWAVVTALRRSSSSGRRSGAGVC